MGRLFRISLAFWANGLRLIDDGGITVADLRAQAGAGCNVPGLERWGWIHIGDGDEGGPRRDGYGSSRGVKPDTVLRPSRGGTWARRVWPDKVAEVEAAWKRRFGPKTVSALNQALRATGLLRPWGLPQVQPADGFRSHVTFAEESPSGKDQARQDDSEASPSLAARLSAMLTAVTLELEADLPVSLPLAANFLRVLAPGPVALRDLPARSGVSKEAVAMGATFLRNRGLATESDRRLELSPTGQGIYAQYQAEVGDRGLGGPSPLRSALVGLLSQTDALASGLRPVEGCWRSERPYLAQTERILADPLGALPHQPMVLHRGGWPDGA